MTTERLNVLAGAAALGEFTAPELAAYTGANPNTVRQVLQREQRHGFFRRQSTKAGSSKKGRAIVWRLDEAHRSEILDEIGREEARVAQLKGVVSEGERAYLSHRNPGERAAMFVTSAEEILARSYSSSDAPERRAFAEIALNLLRAAKPVRVREPRQTGEHNLEWWERSRDRENGEQTASLDTISRVSLESQLKTVQRTLVTLGDDQLLMYRAHRVAAFAALSMRLADRLPLEPDDLMDAAEAISAASAVLPVPQTLSWIRIFVETSIASGNPPPIAILAKPEQSPEHLFPVAQGTWRRVKPPAEIASRGYLIWVESWAKALLLDSLIPGIVLAHDGSPESDETLVQLMRVPKAASTDRAVVVASTKRDFNLVANVSRQGGVFYPVPTDDGFLPAVNYAVAQAMSSSPELAVSYWMATAAPVRGLDAENVSATLLEISRAVSSDLIAPSDLDLAQRTLAELDEAVQLYGEALRHDEKHQADVARNVHEALAALADSRSVLSAALGNYRRIIQIRGYRSPRESPWTRHQGASEVQWRSEARSDMEWAYENIRSDEHVEATEDAEREDEIQQRC
jgi:hypothetical protein